MAVMAADEKSAGKTLNGVPVVADYEKGLSSVKAVFIADRKLDPEKRKEIRERCEADGIEVQDYTGALANLGGRVPVASLLVAVLGCSEHGGKGGTSLLPVPASRGPAR